MTVTILDCDGMDRLTNSLTTCRWTSVAWSSGTATGRWGGYCGQLGGSGQQPIRPLASAYPILLLKFDLMRNQIGSGTLCHFLNGTTSIVDLRKNTDNTLYITRGGTTLATSAQMINLNAWYCVEINLYRHATAGRVILRVNGDVWIDWSGNTGASDINGIKFQNGANSGDLYVDDFVVASGTDVANDRLGDVRIFTTVPVAAGTYADFTPSAGANYAAVDETGQGGDGDTTYNASSTVGHKDSFTWDDIQGTGTVLGVNLVSVARMDDVGPRKFKPLLRRGSDVLGAEFTLGSSYAPFSQLWLTDPIAAAIWTLSNFNNTEFGYQLTQ